GLYGERAGYRRCLDRNVRPSGRPVEVSLWRWIPDRHAVGRDDPSPQRRRSEADRIHVYEDPSWADRAETRRESAFVRDDRQILRRAADAADVEVGPRPGARRLHGRHGGIELSVHEYGVCRPRW